MGSTVVSIDGKDIGTVKQVQGEAFLIDRLMARDLWAPFSAVVRAGPHGGAFRRGPTMDTKIVLIVSADDITTRVAPELARSSDTWRQPPYSTS